VRSRPCLAAVVAGSPSPSPSGGVSRARVGSVKGMTGAGTAAAADSGGTEAVSVGAGGEEAASQSRSAAEVGRRFVRRHNRRL
jgi:hypothetical protein